MSLLYGGTSFHGEGIQRVLYGTTFLLPIFCIAAKVYVSYRLTYSSSNTARLYQLPLVMKRISHSAEHFIQLKMLPQQGRQGMEYNLTHSPQQSSALTHSGAHMHSERTVCTYLNIFQALRSLDQLSSLQTQTSSKYTQKQFCSPGQISEEIMALFICFYTDLRAEVGLGRFTGLILALCPGRNFTLKD